MKYLIIGAGGTGGVVGFHMAQAGKDVTLIARDAHLEWDFSVQQALIDCSGYIKRFTNPGKSRFSGVFLYINGMMWFDQIWLNESRFPPIFSG